MEQVAQQPQRRRIVVAARLRPPNECELEHDTTWSVDAQAKTFKELRSGDTWAFDHAFGTDVDNAGVFEACCNDVITAFCGGVNGTIVTYGQTASGKTHTMHGSEGVVPRAVEEVFSIISEIGGGRQFLLTASYLEIYNEQVVDLLAGGEVNTMEGQNGLVLQNLTHIAVSCPEDVLGAVALGEQRRRIGETSANKRSSRSHVLLRLGLESRLDGETNVRYSQLNLGDLAGSEGLRNVEMTSREQRREGSCINKSLLALSQVVQALSEGGSRGQRIGFRDSKLTRILQPSLGGNAHTVIICTLSPGFASRAESKSTLDFAARARCVENNISVNIRRDGHQDSQIRALEKQLSMLRDRVSSLQMNSGEETANETKDLSEENATLRRKIERLEAAMLGGSALAQVSPLSLAETSVASNAAGKRRRRTIACGAEREHVGLSEKTVRDLMLQLPEGPKNDTKNDSSLSESAFAPRTSIIMSNASFCSAEETPIADLRQSLTCPRLGVSTPVATPQRSALRQPGFLSQRPLARCSTPPKRADVQPVAICFSPMSLLSVDPGSPCKHCELGSISHIDANDSSECLDDLKEESEGQVLLLQDCEQILCCSGNHSADISDGEVAPWSCALVEHQVQTQTQCLSLQADTFETKTNEHVESPKLPKTLHFGEFASEHVPHQRSELSSRYPTRFHETLQGIVRLMQRSKTWIVIDLAFAHWRMALTISRTRRNEEVQDEMRRRLERCACGERQIFDARTRSEAMQKSRRRSSIREDDGDRSPPLFPAGAGAFGTLLKTQCEGNV